MRHIACQRVVVPEADFIDGDGVVFIDDGDDPEFDQGGQGMACIHEAPAVRQILVCEQDLGNLSAQPLERFLVGPHEAALAHGRRRLLHRQALRIRLEAQLLDAGHDRARRDQQQLAAAVLDCRNVLGQSVDPVGSEP